MKIVLEAFGKLRSEVMEWPENTQPKIKLVLRQPLTAKTGFDGQNTGNIRPIRSVCEFEYIGKSYALPDGEFAKIYVLADIYKQ